MTVPKLVPQKRCTWLRMHAYNKVGKVRHPSRGVGISSLTISTLHDGPKAEAIESVISSSCNCSMPLCLALHAQLCTCACIMRLSTSCD